MTKQYWADAATQNCVWIIQVRHNNGWYSEAVYLTKEEALDCLKQRDYYYGEIGKDCKVWGVPAKGMMVDLLGQHNKEFESKVEYITPYKKGKES